MSVAFYGTQETVLSFEAASVTQGHPVKISQNYQVTDAGEGDLPIGVCLHVRKGIAAVQVKGYVELPYSGTTAPGLGWVNLAADGSGGVAVDVDGIPCMVITRNQTDKTVGLYL